MCHLLNFVLMDCLTNRYQLPYQLPYSYKFSRDVYFTDATNSAFSRFYFRGSQDFILVDYVRTIFEDLIFVDHTLSAKTVKFTSLENLYKYGS